MSRPAVKTDESQASGASVASPFDAYSFPVSSPSEADLEPVAPPPQEAADGAEVCEAKNFLQQLAAGRMTTENSAAMGKQGDLTRLVGLGAGALLPFLLSARGRDEADALPQDLREYFGRARFAVDDAKFQAADFPPPSRNPEAYRIGANAIAARYEDAIGELKAMAGGAPSIFLAYNTSAPLKLYLEALEGVIRALYFDLSSPDGLTPIDQDLLSKEPPLLTALEEREKRITIGVFREYQGEIEVLLRAMEESSFSDLASHRYSLRKLAAALAMARGYPGDARLHAIQAIGLSQSEEGEFLGIEELLRLQMKALKRLAQGFDVAQSYDELAGLFEKYGQYEDAIEATIKAIDVRERRYGDSNHNSKPIIEELATLARLITKSSSDPDLHIKFIADQLSWFKQEEGAYLSKAVVEKIARLFEEGGDFRNAAILWSEAIQVFEGTPVAHRYPTAPDEAFRWLVKQLEKGDKGEKTPSPQKSALPDGVSRENIERYLENYLDTISTRRKSQILDAVEAAIRRNGTLPGIIEKGHLTPDGMRFVLEAIGVTKPGIAGPSGVAKAEGFEKGKKDGRKPGRDVVKGSEHVR